VRRNIIYPRARVGRVIKHYNWRMLALTSSGLASSSSASGRKSLDALSVKKTCTRPAKVRPSKIGTLLISCGSHTRSTGFGPLIQGLGSGIFADFHRFATSHSANMRHSNSSDKPRPSSISVDDVRRERPARRAEEAPKFSIIERPFP